MMPSKKLDLKGVLDCEVMDLIRVYQHRREAEEEGKAPIGYLFIEELKYEDLKYKPLTGPRVIGELMPHKIAQRYVLNQLRLPIDIEWFACARQEFTDEERPHWHLWFTVSIGLTELAAVPPYEHGYPFRACFVPVEELLFGIRSERFLRTRYNDLVRLALIPDMEKLALRARIGKGSTYDRHPLIHKLGPR